MNFKNFIESFVFMATAQLNRLTVAWGRETAKQTNGQTQGENRLS